MTLLMGSAELNVVARKPLHTLTFRRGFIVLLLHELLYAANKICSEAVNIIEFGFFYNANDEKATYNMHKPTFKIRATKNKRSYFQIPQPCGKSCPRHIFNYSKPIQLWT